MYTKGWSSLKAPSDILKLKADLFDLGIRSKLPCQCSHLTAMYTPSVFHLIKIAGLPVQEEMTFMAISSKLFENTENNRPKPSLLDEPFEHTTH